MLLKVKHPALCMKYLVLKCIQEKKNDKEDN